MFAWMMSLYGMAMFTVLIFLYGGERERSNRIVFLSLAVIVLILSCLLMITSLRESASQSITFYRI
jgi:succinate-acetate transporter protein